MSQFIEELKREHQWLVSRVNEIRASPDSFNTAAALTSIKKGLLAHLGKEDRKLYPVLEQAAQTDPEIRDLVSLFGNEMKRISAAALAFFDKYKDPDSVRGGDFKKDLEGLYKVLEGRIASEEMTLYTAYARVEAEGKANLPDLPAEELAAVAAAPAQAGARSSALWFGGALFAVAAVSAAILMTLG